MIWIMIYIFEISKLDNSLTYCNYKLDDYFVNEEFELVKETEWTESEQNFVKKWKENSLDLLSKLGIRSGSCKYRFNKFQMKNSVAV